MRKQKGGTSFEIKNPDRQSRRFQTCPVKGKLSNGAAFTLIELLVVIAIIALLMAILMPSLQRVKHQANAIGCLSNLREWGLYFSMYTNDNNGFFHKGWNASGERPYSWMTVLRPYFQHHLILFCCPSATKPLMDENGMSTGRFNVFAAWTNDLGEYGSYGINIWTTNPPRGKEGDKPPEFYWRKRDVRGAANIPLFADDLHWDTRPHHTDEPPLFQGQRDDWTTNAMKMFCMNRHGGFVNSAFVDFSARKVGLKELWTLKWHRQYDITGPWTQAGQVQPSDWSEWMRRFKDY